MGVDLASQHGIPPATQYGAPPPQYGAPPPQYGGPPPPQQYGGYQQCGGYQQQPSMEELGKNAQMNIGAIDQEQADEVKVADMRGNPVPNPESIQSFHNVPFPQRMRDDLINAGFPAPSMIQKYTWPLAIKHVDVVGIAATGSGKTLAFLLPAFAHMLETGAEARDPQLLVMAPTRELAIQIHEEAEKFGKNSGVKCVCVYGGAPKRDQANLLRDGAHGVIGTPGRINDFLEGRTLRLSKVQKLVLDEADRMLDMGFEPQIRKILREVPTRRHTLFFTATWPQEVRKLASEFLYNAHMVTIGDRDSLKANQNIVQLIKIVDDYSKNKTLCTILQQAGVAGGTTSANGAKGLIFCTTKRMCDQLSQALTSLGVPSAAIHGDKDQHERERVLTSFRGGNTQLLIATDVAARGLDINGITLVVNYDMPNDAEDYVHRIGRTARGGAKGYAVTLVTKKEGYKLKGIVEVMKKTNQTIEPEVESLAASAGYEQKRSRYGGGGKGGGKSSGGGGGYGGGRDRSRSRGRGGW